MRTHLLMIAPAALIAPAAALAAAAALIAAAPAAAAPVQLPGGTIIEDVRLGTGEVAQRDWTVTVHYTGWLYRNGKRGKQFDSSRKDGAGDGGQPFSFILGEGEVIKGWEEGVEGMREGGVRTLIIPPEMGYGARQAGEIPANSWLIFDVELIRAR